MYLNETCSNVRFARICLTRFLLGMFKIRRSFIVTPFDFA
jgi:hypothetical protein